MEMEKTYKDLLKDRFLRELKNYGDYADKYREDEDGEYNELELERLWNIADSTRSQLLEIEKNPDLDFSESDIIVYYESDSL